MAAFAAVILHELRRADDAIGQAVIAVIRDVVEAAPDRHQIVAEMELALQMQV